VKRAAAQAAALALVLGALFLPGLLLNLAAPVPGLFLQPTPLAVLATALTGWALLIAPGWLLARVSGTGHGGQAIERPALYFVCSLALLVPPVALTVSRGQPASDFLPLLVAELLALAVAGSLTRPRGRERATPTDNPPGRLLPLLVAACALACTWASLEMVTMGSVDRWWYLAWIHWLGEGRAAAVGDPLLGTATVLPRFTSGAWLPALAAWAELARVDPAWLYHRAVPLLVVPLSFSAAMVLARSLFGRSRAAWLALLITALGWMTGWLIALLARAPEDKIVAAVVVAPVVLGAFLTRARGGWRRWLLVYALGLVALAATHALVYALVLMAVVALAAVLVAGGRCRGRNAAVMLALALVIAAWPALTGRMTTAPLAQQDALSADSTHPVARVHLARERLLQLGSSSATSPASAPGYIVNPRLLLHPLGLLSLACLPLLWRRRPYERHVLLTLSAVALLVAFLPPLPWLLGLAVTPWMVHRVLWLLPAAALLAVGLDEASRRLRATAWLPALLALGLALPFASSHLTDFTRVRAAHALPDTPAFNGLITELSALPGDALLLAAPEISERLVALGGPRVLAASDRATLVFAGNRRSANARLAARARVAAGLWRPGNGAPTPTHLLYDGSGPAGRYCERVIYESDDYRLCSFAAAAPEPGMVLAVTTGGETDQAVDGTRFDCRPGLERRGGRLLSPRPGPWSARMPGLHCRVSLAGSQPAPRLQLGALTGNTNESWIVSVRGLLKDEQRWNLRDEIAVTNETRLKLDLPQASVDELELSIVPTMLPFVKLDHLLLSAADAQERTSR